MEPSARRLEGRCALVTGGAAGIGRATAIRFAQEGARVLICDLNEEGLKETAEAVRAAGGEVTTRKTNVADADDCAAGVQAAVDALGALDILANVAGVALHGHAVDTPIDGWDRTLAVNLSGVFYMCRAALPHLLERHGNIVNVASSAGLVGVPYSVAYCASKGGVVQLTRALAVEFSQRRVRVNCVCPGGVRTEMVKGFVPPEDADMKLLSGMQLMPRLARPEEIAAAIAYLASDEARYVTGTALAIDGGQTAA